MQKNEQIEVRLLKNLGIFLLVPTVGTGVLGILCVFAFSLLEFRNIEKLFTSVSSV